MVSLDVKSLFTSVSITKAVDILGRVCNRKEISTVLKKDEMKKLLTFYNKIVHFTLNNEIYVQDNGVTMDFPLGKILEMYLW